MAENAQKSELEKELRRGLMLLVQNQVKIKGVTLDEAILDTELKRDESGIVLEWSVILEGKSGKRILVFDDAQANINFSIEDVLKEVKHNTFSVDTDDGAVLAKTNEDLVGGINKALEKVGINKSNFVKLPKQKE